MLFKYFLRTKNTYVYLVHFWLIIITWFTNPLIPERSCTQISSNMRGGVKRVAYYEEVHIEGLDRSPILNHVYFDAAWKLERESKTIYNFFDKRNQILKYMV